MDGKLRKGSNDFAKLQICLKDKGYKKKYPFYHHFRDANFSITAIDPDLN